MSANEGGVGAETNGVDVPKTRNPPVGNNIAAPNGNSTNTSPNLTETRNGGPDRGNSGDETDRASYDIRMINARVEGGDDIDRPQRITNSFAAKKTVAQGMMDIALITANANQLRYIIAYTHGSSTYLLNLVLISISLILQVAVGIALIFKGRYDMKGMKKSPRAQRLNNYVVVAVFLITIINVFVASFSSPTPTEDFKRMAGVDKIQPRNDERMAAEAALEN